MQVPSDEFIDVAKTQLVTIDQNQINDQKRELLEIEPEASAPFIDGYQLGLQTARVIIETHPLLARNGIKPDDIL